MKEANLHTVDNESFTRDRVLGSYQALSNHRTTVYASSAGERPRWTGSDEDILEMRKLAYVSEVLYVYLVLVLSGTDFTSMVCSIGDLVDGLIV